MEIFLVPSKGIASDTWGKVSATKFRNTVSESNIVTPVTMRHKNSNIFQSHPVLRNQV